MQQVTVLKFGGTSMGDEHTWRKVMAIISNYAQPVVVVSATAHTTRKLVSAAQLAPSNLDGAFAIAREISERHKSLIENLMANCSGPKSAETKDQCFKWIENQQNILNDYLRSVEANGVVTNRQKDAICSIGERLSSYLFASCGAVFQLNTTWVDAQTVIATDSQYGSANPDLAGISKNSKRLSKAVAKMQIPVIGGFYGAGPDGEITTLGFEGSDYTASLIGAALNASAIEIWTDVSGIFTCDPRVVSEAKPIKELSFTEATELAYFGAKVLHPSTMKPAAKKQIPVRVKNIFEPDHPGTIIHTEAACNGPARALTFLGEVTILNIKASDGLKGPQFLEQAFKMLNTLHLPVDVVTTTEASLSLALESSRINASVRDALDTLGDVNPISGQAVISLIGCASNHMEDILQTVLQAVSKAEIAMISFSNTKKNVNLVLPKKKLMPTLKAIHSKIF